MIETILLKKGNRFFYSGLVPKPCIGGVAKKTNEASVPYYSVAQLGSVPLPRIGGAAKIPNETSVPYSSVAQLGLWKIPLTGPKRFGRLKKGLGIWILIAQTIVV